MSKMCFNDRMEIEDYLQQQEVFKNGISGKPCHSDSYMTIVDFDNALKALEADKDWLAFKKGTLDAPNTQPAMKIFCALIQETADA